MTAKQYKGRSKESMIKAIISVFFIVIVVISVIIMANNLSTPNNNDNNNETVSNMTSIKDKPTTIILNKTINKTNKTIKLKGENIAIVHYGNLTYIASKPNIHSKEDLETYKQRGKNRLIELVKTHPDEKIFAIVTFKKPLSEQKLNDMLKENDVFAYMVRYVSYPEGSGAHPWPISNDERDILEKMSKSIKNNFIVLYNDSKNKKLGENKNSIDWANFKLIDGYVAAKVHAKPKNLLKLQEHQDVFMVDCGSIEFEENYSVSEVRATDDIYDEYKKY